MIKRAVVMVGAAVFLVTGAALAQDGRFDVSAGGAAVFSRQTSGNGVVLAPTQNAAFIGSLALHMSPAAALQVNFGHSDNSQKYVSGGLDFRVKTTITEFSGAFVFSPIRSDRYKVFVFGGGGALVFNPNSTLINETPQSIGATRQTRPTVLYGVGLDYSLISRVALRLQYRGLFYSPPDFRVANLLTGGRGHMAEPAVGLVFSF